MSTPENQAPLPAEDPLEQLAAAEAEAAGTAPAEPETPAEMEARKWAERFDSPEALEQGYQNLLQEFRRRDEEVGTYRQLFNQMQEQQPATQAQPQQDQLMSEAEWNNWYETNPMQAIAYLQQVQGIELLNMVEERLDERVSPLQQAEETRTGNRTLELLKGDPQVGAEALARHQAELIPLLERNQAIFDQMNEQDRHNFLRGVIIAAESRGGAQPGTPAVPQAGRQETVHMAAGSGPQPAGGQEDAGVDPIIGEMRAAAAATHTNDVFSQTPRPFIPPDDPARRRR